MVRMLIMQAGEQARIATGRGIQCEVQIFAAITEVRKEIT
mgnify:CR=1 FL=1